MNPQHATFMREDAARTARHAALTEGLTGIRRAMVEQLMDNAERYISEETDTSKIAVFTRVAKPLIRRIYAGLVANDLVSIQPMTMPTQKVFFLDFLRQTNQSPTVAGDRNDYEANKPNKFYAGGVIKGEVIGTGDGSNKNFNTALFPVRPSSVTVYVSSVPTTAYTLNEVTGAIVFTAAPSAAASVTADYALVMEGLGSKGNSQIAELGLSMSSATVDAEEMKLKTRWTLESQQDLKAYFGLSIEDELTKQLGDEMRRELDRLIIDDLVANATAANFTWSKAIPGTEKRSEHYETLIHAIGDVSNEIYKKRLKHATFVVLAPDTLQMLDKTNTFRLTSGQGADGSPTAATLSAGPNVFGTLANRYNVVVDPLFPTNKVLVGHKGDDWQSTGYVYAPYVAFATETWTDPNTMKPVKGLMSRFGRHLVNGDFYGTITITA